MCPRFQPAAMCSRAGPALFYSGRGPRVHWLEAVLHTLGHSGCWFRTLLAENRFLLMAARLLMTCSTAVCTALHAAACIFDTLQLQHLNATSSVKVAGPVITISHFGSYKGNRLGIQ
jgi:hypothetical protein